MTIHELKTWEQPFRDIVCGNKTHEVRKDDRNFKVGDVLVLRQWLSLAHEYTGREARVVVTHKTTGYGLPDDMCVMSIRLLDVMRA